MRYVFHYFCLARHFLDKILITWLDLADSNEHNIKDNKKNSNHDF